MKNIESNFKRRLVFVIEFSDMTGGMLHSTYLLIKELKGIYEVIVICPEGEFEKCIKDIGVHVSILMTKTWNIHNPISAFLLLYKLRSRLNSFRAEGCILITNNIMSQFLVSICHYKKRFNYIYFNRGGTLKNKIGRIVVAFSKKNDVVICTSQAQKDVVEYSGILKHGAKCVVLYNPIEKVEIPSFNENFNGCCLERVSDEGFVIGVVGYVDVGKNQLLAIESLKEIHKMGLIASLEIYGECNNLDYLEVLKVNIDKLGLNDYVSFHGYVDDKIFIYSRINLLLSTSLSEGFGRTLAESMLHRKPVVALECSGGPRDIVKSKEYGLLVNESPIDIANAVYKFATDNIYRDNAVNTAYSFAEQEFSPKKIALKFERLVEDKF